MKRRVARKINDRIYREGGACYSPRQHKAAAAFRRRAWKRCGCSGCKRAPADEERLRASRVQCFLPDIMRVEIDIQIIRSFMPCPSRAPEPM
mgnify:CR=1 FL=1